MDVERAIELMDGAYTAVDESVIIPRAGYRLIGIIKTSLCEQQEREKGCEYCTGVQETNDSGREFYKELPDEYGTGTGTSCLAHDKRGWAIHWEDDGEYGLMYDMRIKTCPKCGRRLKEAKKDGKD